MDNRKLLAVIVGIVVVVAAVSAAVVVLNNNRSDDSTFEYQNFYDDKQYSHKYRYSDEYFMKDSTEYDNSLATMSMCMNMASVAYIGGNYSEQCRFIEELMKKIGFENIYINDDYKNKPTEFSMGVIIGSKVIENKTLLGVFTVEATILWNGSAISP